MLKVELLGDKEALRELRRLPREVQQALQRALAKSAAAVEGEAKRIVYGGHPDHLKGDSGRLRQSITHEVNEGSAAVGTNVVYARIHEEGGNTGPRTIVPVNAQALRFEIGGNVIFAKSVEHPGSEIPARPFLKPALDAKQNEVRNNLSNAVRGVLP